MPDEREENIHSYRRIIWKMFLSISGTFISPVSGSEPSNMVGAVHGILRDYYITFPYRPWYQIEIPISSPTAKLEV
jgi:hypothetical protein